MNAVFFAIVLVAFLVGGYHQWNWEPSAADSVSPMAALGTAMVDAAGGAVTLAIGLVGMMALFLGLMKVAEAGGLLTIIAKTLRPLMVRAFPEVPADHPAMGAMILNLSANALGLANAATPFGIRAMQELDKLNPVKGTASNAMVLFLAMNTSSVTLLPTGVMALRVAGRFPGPGGHPADDAVCDLRLDGRGIRCCEGVPTVLGGGTCRDARFRGPAGAGGRTGIWRGDPPGVRRGLLRRVSRLGIGDSAGGHRGGDPPGRRLRCRSLALDHSGADGRVARVRCDSPGPCLRSLRGRRARRVPGGASDHSVPRGHLGGGRHAPRQRRARYHRRLADPSDVGGRPAGGRAADGPHAAAVRLGCVRHSGIDHPGPGHRTGTATPAIL